MDVMDVSDGRWNNVCWDKLAYVPIVICTMLGSPVKCPSSFMMRWRTQAFMSVAHWITTAERRKLYVIEPNPYFFKKHIKKPKPKNIMTWTSWNSVDWDERKKDESRGREKRSSLIDADGNSFLSRIGRSLWLPDNINTTEPWRIIVKGTQISKG